MNARSWSFLWFIFGAMLYVCVGQSDRTYNFKLMADFRIASGATQVGEIQQQERMTSTQCAQFCRSNCNLFHYSHVTDVCVLFEERHFDSGPVFEADSEWTIGIKRISTVENGDWTLVFRAQSEIGLKVYDVWTATGVHNDNPILTNFPSSCLRMDDYTSCDRHFRSHILDTWANVQQVYMSWVKNDAEVAYVVFDGVGSDRDSWFSPTRIANSTWAPSILNDVSQLYLTTIYGHCTPAQCRRFYLHGPHTYCDTEWFYSYTVDYHPDWCMGMGWEPTLVTTIPTFLYSPTKGRVDMGVPGPYPFPDKADVLAIWVKFI